jgi:hypothetical protein
MVQRSIQKHRQVADWLQSQGDVIGTKASAGSSIRCASGRQARRRCQPVADGAWWAAGAALGAACECRSVRSAYRAAQRKQPYPPSGGRLNGKTNGTGLPN